MKQDNLIEGAVLLDRPKPRRSCYAGGACVGSRNVKGLCLLRVGDGLREPRGRGDIAAPHVQLAVLMLVHPHAGLAALRATRSIRNAFSSLKDAVRAHWRGACEWEADV
jgi:hypothetical protein